MCAVSCAWCWSFSRENPGRSLLGFECPEDLHGQHQVLESIDAEVADGALDVGHGVGNTEEGGIHQLQDFGGDSHVLLDDFGDFLKRRVRVRQRLGQSFIGAGERRQVPQGGHRAADRRHR